jgi:predicted RNase H-like HicB family nuclease
LEVIYQAVFERADDGSIFAYVPDLPGCTSWGTTLDEAAVNITEAAQLWVDHARESSEQLPQSSTIASLGIKVAAA